MATCSAAIQFYSAIKNIKGIVLIYGLDQSRILLFVGFSNELMMTQVMNNISRKIYIRVWSINVGSSRLFHWHIDGLVHERRNSIALAMELRFSRTNPSMWERNANYRSQISLKRYHLTSIGNPIGGDKATLRYEISHTGKVASLYWISP